MSDVVNEAVSMMLERLSRDALLLGKQCDLLEKALNEKKKELDETMSEIKELHEFLNPKAEEKPEKKTRKGGRPRKKKETEEEAEMKTETENETEQQWDAGKSIEEVNGEAKKFGLSYGQFLAKKEIERQHEEMKRSRELRHANKAVEEE